MAARTMMPGAAKKLRGEGLPVRTEFAYARGFFLQRLLVFVGFAAALLAFLGIVVQRTPLESIVALAVLLGVFGLVWGLSPLLTSHAIQGNRIVLRQGWYFRAVLPIRSLEAIGPFDGTAPLGLRARGGRLFVTGSTIDLIVLRLRIPRRFWAVLWAEADEIVFDVDSRQRFLEAVRERQASLPPVQTKRADPYLRD